MLGFPLVLLLFFLLIESEVRWEFVDVNAVLASLFRVEELNGALFNVAAKL